MLQIDLMQSKYNIKCYTKIDSRLYIYGFQIYINFFDSISTWLFRFNALLGGAIAPPSLYRISFRQNTTKYDWTIMYEEIEKKIANTYGLA